MRYIVEGKEKTECHGYGDYETIKYFYISDTTKDMLAEYKNVHAYKKVMRTENEDLAIQICKLMNKGIIVYHNEARDKFFDKYWYGCD